MSSFSQRGARPGFQNSETTSVEVRVYEPARGLGNDPTLDDPILLNANKAIVFDGSRRQDKSPSLLACKTSKAIGAAGMWSFVAKDGTFDVPLHERLVDDLWVDIIFKRHNRPYHVMRGTIDDVQRSKVVDASGATTTAYTVSGRDFQKIWELTPLWFNKFTQENLAGGAALQIFNAVNLAGTVPDTVKAFLFGFLRELNGRGRANWRMPATMPGVTGIGFADELAENIVFVDDDFSNDPPRVALNGNFMDPDGANAWAMAQEWSDPSFCEMWADLIPSEGYGVGDEEGQISVDDTKMAVILRDRPFPNTAQGRDSLWYRLPIINVRPESIVSSDLTRSGTERFTAFFVSPQIVQESMLNDAIEVTAPLWSDRDMLVHGFRRYDIMSRYKADFTDPALDAEKTALLTLTVAQREKVRDWYAINPYLWNGTISLGHGRPEARVGSRLRIPGKTKDTDEWFYIEMVDNEWQFGQGIRTSFGVTRGWFGSENSYLEAIQRLADRYGGNNQTFGQETAVPATGEGIG